MPDAEGDDRSEDELLEDAFFAEEDDQIEPSRAVDRFRRTTVVGAVLNGVALGLREVLEPVKKEEAPIVQDAPGEPDRPQPVDADLDPDDPGASTVTVRPWLMGDGASQDGSQQPKDIEDTDE